MRITVLHIRLSYFRVVLKPGYDPIKHKDDGFSVTVFFADAGLAAWYNNREDNNGVSEGGSNTKWWDIMPRHEVKIQRVDFLMMTEANERFWPHLWYSQPVDIEAQARTFTNRSWYSPMLTEAGTSHEHQHDRYKSKTK